MGLTAGGSIDGAFINTGGCAYVEERHLVQRSERPVWCAMPRAPYAFATDQCGG